MGIINFFKFLLHNHNFAIIFVCLLVVLYVSHTEDVKLKRISVTSSSHVIVTRNRFKTHLDRSMYVSIAVYSLFLFSLILLYISQHSEKYKVILFNFGMICLCIESILELLETVYHFYYTIDDHFDVLHNKKVLSKELRNHVYYMGFIGFIHLIICYEFIAYFIDYFRHHH